VLIGAAHGHLPVEVEMLQAAIHFHGGLALLVPVELYGGDVVDPALEVLALDLRLNRQIRFRSDQILLFTVGADLYILRLPAEVLLCSVLEVMLHDLRFHDSSSLVHRA
jgi:hypothetical protein